MQKIIEEMEFIKDLSRLNFVEEILLYGSRARGDHEERSDIDIAIRCSMANDKEWLTTLDIVDEADTLLKIDCLRLESLKEGSDLKKNILSEGIYLYKAQ